MSDNVVDATKLFEAARVKAYKQFAVKFVEKYINESPTAAGVYALNAIGEKDHEEVAPYVEEEFLRRGYEIRPKGGE